MATTKITLTSAWVQVATDAQEFLVENISSYVVDITFSATAPAVDAPYHSLRGGDGISRLGVDGALYARSSDGASVVISTGA